MATVVLLLTALVGVAAARIIGVSSLDLLDDEKR
jgi:hypothetical protein